MNILIFLYKYLNISITLYLTYLIIHPTNKFLKDKINYSFSIKKGDF
jgi:hypothetical protein